MNFSKHSRTSAGVLRLLDEDKNEVHEMQTKQIVFEEENISSSDDIFYIVSATIKKIDFAEFSSKFSTIERKEEKVKRKEIVQCPHCDSKFKI